MNAPPYAKLLAGLDVLLLRRQAGRTFTAPEATPEWFRLFAAEPLTPGQPIEPGPIFPFLDHFLDDAERFWDDGGGRELRSGFWAESAPDGDLHFEAVAFKADGADYLLMRRLGAGFDQIQHVLQKGRELSLVHERLVSEIGKKEILLHCVIHDMSGPLQGMIGSLEVAKNEMRSEVGKRLVALGLLSAKQQASLIDDLLDTFRTEMTSADAISVDPATAPDPLASATAVLAMLEPAFSVRGLKGEIHAAEGTEVVRVAAEKSRLERVLYNLLQNAMRYSPRGGVITVSMREEESFLRIAIEDQGPGVPPEVVPQLFQKFVRRGQTRGKAGLGLFFCRITVEGWGGSIGCEPRAGGGTSFWFRLKRI